MVASIETVALVGVLARPVEVQVQISGGMPSFMIVGLPDKAVSEARERVRAALSAIGLSLPPERITINLSPADLPKEGSHYDLPIALGLLVAMDVLPADAFDGSVVMGELGLDGSIRAVPGVLPAAMAAGDKGMSIICPDSCGAEAAWAADTDVIAPKCLMTLINHMRGTQVLSPPVVSDETVYDDKLLDLKDIKGQEVAKRALEVAACGNHNLLMVGPPGSGKSMLASRLPSILPTMTSREILETSIIASVAGLLSGGKLSNRRPFRNPHHSASQPALIGGGAKAKPGEVSLAHGGVLFLDELPEFSRSTIEALRQPIESGEAVIARAAAHVTYPARFQLIAAMNPCRCGHLDDAGLACNKAPRCALDYQAKISGPMFDRIDIHIDVPAMSALDLTLPAPREGSAEVAARVEKVRQIQMERYEILAPDKNILVNAHVDGELLDKVCELSDGGRKLLTHAVTSMKLSARGYHRVLRLARTLADMAFEENIADAHIAEALSYRRIAPQMAKVY